MTNVLSGIETLEIIVEFIFYFVTHTLVLFCNDVNL